MSEAHSIITRQWEPGLALEGGKAARRFAKGDYVLATKYNDGDPLDGYGIGFFDSYLAKGSGHRYMVVGSDGRQFRGNGFRRCERISDELGHWLVKHRPAFEAIGMNGRPPISLWRFKYRGEPERLALERWAADAGRQDVEAHRMRWFANAPPSPRLLIEGMEDRSVMPRFEIVGGRWRLMRDGGQPGDLQRRGHADGEAAVESGGEAGAVSEGGSAGRPD